MTAPPTYDDGGSVAPSAPVPAGPPQLLGASPQVQQLYQRYAQMPLNQLQRLAVMTPAASAQGQMIQRAMKAKQMAPASNGAFPNLGSPVMATPSAAPMPPGYASGGGSSGGSNGVTVVQSGPGGGSTSLSSIASPGYGIAIPQVSYTPSQTGMVGPTWSPGQALLSPASSITTSPPGFGGTPQTPPLMTSLPPSVLNANAVAPTPSLTPTQAQQLQSLLQQQQQQALAQQINQETDNLRRGGLVPMRADGGFPSVAPSDGQMAATTMRNAERSQYHPGGFIHSPVGGRTDHLALSVPVDAHVIPADVVSGIGQGNGLNGGALLDAMFHSGPWGVKAQKVAGARPRFPNPPPPASFAAGGRPEPTTDIMAAGGEYIVRPEAVALFGRAAKRLARGKLDRKSDLQAGHDAIDTFILRARRHTIATMRRLPGPVKG